MVQNNYSFNSLKENMAKASGRNLNISMKQSIEICNYVRGRPLSQAKMLLQQAIDMEKPIPFKRFTNGLGHKPGMAAGRYHPKACSEILKILKSAEANAKNKGFSAADLKVLHIAAQTAAKQPHYGRKRRSIFKNAHIEIILEEVKGLGSEKKSAKTRQNQDKKENKKQDVKRDNKKVNDQEKRLVKND